jgi:hypothetical protein
MLLTALYPNIFELFTRTVRYGAAYTRRFLRFLPPERRWFGWCVHTMTAIFAERRGISHVAVFPCNPFASGSTTVIGTERLVT